MSLKTPLKKLATLSPVWVVPAVALAIALWLAVQAYLEKGTEIKISFSKANDIVPGQTLIKFKDIKVGVVKDIRLDNSLRGVLVTAELDRRVAAHLSADTRFWVATPRISVAGVSNLGTLISGVHIVMDPGVEGEHQTDFKGLDQTPLLQSDEPGKAFVLQSPGLASIDIGSPIYFRQIRVGEVTGYQLSDNHKHVDINVFIRSPHDELIENRTRFWNVSGFGFSLGAEGLKANVASLASIINGGISFDNAAGIGAGKPAEPGQVFYLHPDKESVLEGQFNIKYFYLTKFSGSIRGLSVGAPVEFKGIKVGEVVDVSLERADNAEKTLHVYIAMEPQRFDPGESPTKEEVDLRMQSMVEQGLRAQMRVSSLLTGAKFIDLAYVDNPGDEMFVRSENYSEIPTVEEPAEQIMSQVSALLGKFNEVPFGDIGKDLSKSLSKLNTILATLEKNNTAQKVDDVLVTVNDTLNTMNATLNDSSKTIQQLGNTVSPDSELQYELNKMLRSVSEAAKSIEVLTDELGRNPNALIYGSKNDE